MPYRSWHFSAAVNVVNSISSALTRLDERTHQDLNLPEDEDEDEIVEYRDIALEDPSTTGEPSRHILSKELTAKVLNEFPEWRKVVESGSCIEAVPTEDGDYTLSVRPPGDKN